MNVGDMVRVLPPFDEVFAGLYVIREIVGTTAHLDGIPEGFADAFDFSHLEVADPLTPGAL